MYEDIIALSHHRSAIHAPMSVTDRAAQFSPFAALTGYGDALDETARLTQERIELDEYEKARLDATLQQIRARLNEHPPVTLTYFCPDGQKAGGAYLTLTGRVKKLDEAENALICDSTPTGEVAIPIEDIIAIVPVF